MRKTVDYNCAFLKHIEDRCEMGGKEILHEGEAVSSVILNDVIVNVLNFLLFKVLITFPVVKKLTLPLKIAGFGSAETGGTGEPCSRT